jgi:hypothetical protein
LFILYLLVLTGGEVSNPPVGSNGLNLMPMYLRVRPFCYDGDIKGKIKMIEPPNRQENVGAYR